MVAELTSFLHQIYETRSFSSDTLEVFCQILQALVEMCTGNFRNCEEVFEANIMSVLNYVFQIDITEVKGDRQSANEFTATVLTNFNDLESMAEGLATTTTSENKVDYMELRNRALQLKGTAVELLKVMLEKISSKTESLAQQIFGGLDIYALQWTMVDFYTLQDDKGIAQQHMSDFASRSLFVTYNIFMDLFDNNAAPLKTLGNKSACIILECLGTDVTFTKNSTTRLNISAHYNLALLSQYHSLVSKNKLLFLMTINNFIV